MKGPKLLLCCSLVSVAVGAWAESVRTVERLAPDIWRVRVSHAGAVREGHLNRYGVIAKFAPTEKSADLSALPVGLSVDLTGRGWSLSAPLKPDTRVYGLGDVSRKNLNRRGHAYDIWVANVTSYIPIPMLMTSEGWGLFVNTTYRSRFDVGAQDPARLRVSVVEGDADVYVFTGRDYRQMLDAYTRLTGRPALLPAFGFGFAYVANQWIDQFEVTEEAWRFRNLDLPCDIIGLEPGWMEYFYDFTTKKNWNARFAFPAWTKSRSVSWIGALERMHFKLSLWLCMNYDLFVFEEACAAGLAKPSAAKTEWSAADTMPNVWQDEHIEGKFSKEDAEIPKLRRVANVASGAARRPVARVEGFGKGDESGDEPWFEHLKKFVDRGARCFKLDGSMQCHDFKTRRWNKGRMSSDEVHNMYPVIYAKQMAEGFEAYTSRRAMVYTSCGYAGLQRYVASWAGDTGGGTGALVSCLNLGLSGHPNQSCDMSIFDSRSLHFGIFAPWCQQNNWDYFQQPWYQDSEGLETFRKYLHLRYRLFPYLYTTAATAARTGWPIMRPLAFVYPEKGEYADEQGTYMIGDSLLVSSFVDYVRIPEGVWYEWRTGKPVQGPTTLKVAATKDWGGALYVKAGAIIPMWPDKAHLERGWNESVEFHVWPGGDSTFELYEDDGDSLAYRNGASSRTVVRWQKGVFSVGARTGSFKGMPVKRNFSHVVH